MVLPLIIAAAGVAVAAAGVGMSVYGSSQQASAQAAAAAQNRLISQEQAKASRVQYESAEELAIAQERLLDLQRRQNQLKIKTEKDVISLQRAQDDVRRLQNTVTSEENTFKLEATKRQETLNLQNDSFQRSIFATDLQKDALNRQNDNLERAAEFIQGRQSALAQRKQQREIVRQGILARSQATSQAVGKGRGLGDSGRQAAQQTLGSRERLAGADSAQDFQLAESLRTLGIAKRELGVQSRELGVQQRLVGEQQFELGVQGRREQFNVAQNSFSAQGQRLALNDSLFGLSSRISDAYLQSQDMNASLVNEAYDANRNLSNTNKKATQALLSSQERVYQMGGNVSLANMNAASAGALAGFGAGLSNVGGMIINNQSTFNRIGEYFSTPTQAAEPSYQFQPATGVGEYS